MLYPEHMKNALETLKPEHFLTEFNKSVYVKLRDLYNADNFELSYLNEYFDADKMGRIQSMVEKRRMVSVNGLDTLGEAIKALIYEKESADAKSGNMSFTDRINAVKRKKGIGENKDNPDL